MNIYFLTNGKDVVYVGKTNDVKRRIKQHNDKKFDNYFSIVCDDEDANHIEDEYIKMLDPLYNNSLNRFGHYISLSDFCIENNLDIERARYIYHTTPYVTPIFNENFSPYTLNMIKAIYENGGGF